MSGISPSPNWVEYTTDRLIAEGQLVIGDGYRAKNSELASEGIPFARAGNIDGEFRFDNADRFPVENLERVGSKASQPGDVVFTSKGTVGRILYVEESTPRFVYSPQLCFWRSSDSSFLDSRWLYYWMHGKEFRHQVAGVKGQTDMADYVSLSDQRRMRITMPSISVQRRIAHTLGTFDAKIWNNTKTARHVEQLTETLFRAWFVDGQPISLTQRDVLGPNRDLGPLSVSPHGSEGIGDSHLPPGWEIRSVASLATYRNGLALQRFPPAGTPDDLPVVKIAQLRRGSVEGADRAGRDVPSEYVIQDGDLLFSWSGTLEVKFWFGGVGALNQHIFRVVSRQYPTWFVFLWLRHHLSWFRLIATSKATTMGHIKKEHLIEAKAKIPPPEIIASADEIMSPLFALHAHVSVESRSLAMTRDHLMPRLLSGELEMPSLGAEYGR